MPIGHHGLLSKESWPLCSRKIRQWVATRNNEACRLAVMLLSIISLKKLPVTCSGPFLQLASENSCYFVVRFGKQLKILNRLPKQWRKTLIALAKLDALQICQNWSQIQLDNKSQVVHLSISYWQIWSHLYFLIVKLDAADSSCGTEQEQRWTISAAPRLWWNQSVNPVSCNCRDDWNHVSRMRRIKKTAFENKVSPSGGMTHALLQCEANVCPTHAQNW